GEKGRRATCLEQTLQAFRIATGSHGYFESVNASQPNIFGKIRNLWERLIPGRQDDAGASKNVSQIYAGKAAPRSAEKQKKLEEMCEKLFEQKVLLTTGKMQLIGLSKIKKRLGKTWPGLQKIVYQTVDDAIAKYMSKADIFIRYKDDTYVILFANSSP